jgi:hypothetical protein
MKQIYNYENIRYLIRIREEKERNRMGAKKKKLEEITHKWASQFERLRKTNYNWLGHDPQLANLSL